jgi:hypothetical protein
MCFGAGLYDWFVIWCDRLNLNLKERRSPMAAAKKKVSKKTTKKTAAKKK